MGSMPDTSAADARLLTPAQVAEILAIEVEDVLALVMAGQLRGMRVGGAAQWRIDERSVQSYLDDQVEQARRMALWHQSQTASFPELWGTGAIRNPD